MEDPELQGLRIAQDEDGALRFKDYILGEKSRIIKKSLPGSVAHISVKKNTDIPLRCTGTYLLWFFVSLRSEKKISPDICEKTKKTENQKNVSGYSNT